MGNIKTRNGIDEINKVCKAALKLTDADFAEVEKMYEEQAAYCHPFKMATATKQHELGSHNQRVVETLKALRNTIQGIPMATEANKNIAVTNVKFKKDWLVEDQDEDVGEDEKLKSISIYECCSCHWIFAGDCERYGYGYTSQSTQTPNYCPMCGAKIEDCID